MNNFLFDNRTIAILLVVFMVLCPSFVYSQQRMSVSLPNDAAVVKKAKAGDADAQAFVGKCYYFGECGVKENDKEAFRWFQRSVQKKSPYGYYYIALCYSNGFGVSQNEALSESYFEKAVKIFRTQANEGDAEAQYYLGLCYQNGTGVEESQSIANSWFGKAAEQGHPNAQYETALNEKDKSKAFTMMKNAADHGIREAIYQLGVYCRNGIGCEVSIEDGTSYILNAAQMGDGDAQVCIAYCYEEGDGVRRDISEAFKWFKKAADENGMYKGYLETGCKYRDGHGVDHNYDLAVKYLKEASELEDYRDLEASEALRILRLVGRTKLLQNPVRCSDDIYELSEDDPFTTYPIRGMEKASNAEKMKAAKSLKRDKIHAWGPDIAMKTAMGTYEIGYSMEQIAFAIRDQYTKRYFDIPQGTIYVYVTHDRNFYFKDNSLFALIWDNGMTVGDLTFIRDKNGNVKFIHDL